MKCFAHVASDAVGQCNGCQVGLCGDCVTRFTIPSCERCFVSHNKAVALEMYKGLGITAVIFALGVWFAFSHPMPGAKTGTFLLMGLLLSFTYWGWRFLSEYFPRLSGGSIIVWFFYLGIKLIAAYLVGILVGPYRIYKMARELHLARKENKRVVVQS